jgi:SAM-dependent methyltransferase
LTFSASGNYLCNLCGATCERTPEPPGRETIGCAQCGSTVRLRGLVAMLSHELFGTQLALPDFPEMKGLRGFGMSDPHNLASQLEAKFDYTNTFYHQPPTIDIVHPDEKDWGRYDFIISSEVMEHVPPPVENSFANLYRLLKPNGVLLLTVPYGIGIPPKEHFPELDQHALAKLGGKTVLVNRRRDGTIQTFEDLCFHGGDGSTLEQRVFTEDTLKTVLKGAGFEDVHIASEDIPEVGVEHNETWSLPIVARKGKIEKPIANLAQRYLAELARRPERQQIIDKYEAELTRIRADYQQYVEAHESYKEKVERQLAERLDWGQQHERLAAEQTKWALKQDEDHQSLMGHIQRMDADHKTLIAHLEQVRADGEHAKAEAQAHLERLEARKWIRLGRKLGLL